MIFILCIAIANFLCLYYIIIFCSAYQNQSKAWLVSSVSTFFFDFVIYTMIECLFCVIIIEIKKILNSLLISI